MSGRQDGSKTWGQPRAKESVNVRNARAVSDEEIDGGATMQLEDGQADRDCRPKKSKSAQLIRPRGLEGLLSRRSDVGARLQHPGLRLGEGLLGAEGRSRATWASGRRATLLGNTQRRSLLLRGEGRSQLRTRERARHARSSSASETPGHAHASVRTRTIAWNSKRLQTSRLGRRALQLELHRQDSLPVRHGATEALSGCGHSRRARRRPTTSITPGRALSLREGADGLIQR